MTEVSASPLLVGVRPVFKSDPDGAWEFSLRSRLFDGRKAVVIGPLVSAWTAAVAYDMALMILGRPPKNRPMSFYQTTGCEDSRAIWQGVKRVLLLFIHHPADRARIAWAPYPFEVRSND